MTLLDLYKKAKRISGYFNSADIPLKYNGKDFNIDFEIKSKDAIVSHIEVKQDLALTWEDIASIVILADTILDGNEEEWRKQGAQAYYEAVLKAFNALTKSGRNESKKHKDR